MKLLFPRIRDLLIGLLVTMAIVLLLAFAQLARQLHQDLTGSRWVTETNHLSNALFREAMSVATERGLVTLALGLPELPPDLQAALHENRQAAAVLHRDLLRQTERVVHDSDAPALALLASTMGERHAALERMRVVVSQHLAGREVGVSTDVWFRTAMLYNESLARMHDAICSVRAASFAFFDFCPSVKRDVFWVGEYATRERGLIAGVIAAKRPLTPADLGELRAYRAVIEHNLDRISNGARSQFLGQLGIGAVVGQVRAEYAGPYAALLREVVSAGTAGADYPVDATTWYRLATSSINPLLDLTRTVAAAVDESVAQFRADNLRSAAGLAILLLVMVSALIATVVVVQRRVISRLGQLQTSVGTIAEGDLTRSVAVHGVDELGELGDAFERMRRALLADRGRREATETRLRAANEELARFAYVVSHDLKAPLRAIHNLAGWIAEDMSAHLTADGSEHLQLLQSRVRRMDNLINALLEYSRAGRRVGAAEEVSTRDLIEEVILLRGKPDGFTVTVREPMPRLTTDRVQLQQVFANLIGNAIEHHDRGNGHIEVSAEEGDTFWRFAVCDDGPGIPPDQQGRIFEIFQRLDTRDSGGTGIGLAIVKKAVERLGGSVTVESAPGRGATFRFTWPKRLPLEPSGETVAPLARIDA